MLADRKQRLTFWHQKIYSDLLMEKPFTTGEAAKICNVSQQTIIRCFDSGALKGFRVPGSRFRRIPRDILYRFMKDSDIPTDGFEQVSYNADSPEEGDFEEGEEGMENANRIVHFLSTLSAKSRNGLIVLLAQNARSAKVSKFVEKELVNGNS